ncbi:glycoside hydrolase family 30 protein [candidate division KSB1 bacterium]|nr:glycoside hydrolase family 30 protein [candidate division KSB1 bacterium]
MRKIYNEFFILIFIIFISCSHSSYQTVRLFQTSKSGDQLTDKGLVSLVEKSDPKLATIVIVPTIKYQKIVGFGGAFTESSASILDQLSEANRSEVIQKYFGPNGAAYSLTRTHINSCDFSLSTYAYDMVANDKELKHFTIQEDIDDLIPFIQDAMKVSKDGFKILASPWTAPPWMKENNSWYDGALKQEYYPTWALYFSKYIHAYQEQGIDIWGVTVENEPLGNGGQWESMTFTPETHAEFIKDHLGPQFKADRLETEILVYDQNRDHLQEWASMLQDPEVAKYVWGTAVHWYSSTVDWYPDELNAVHEQYPDKALMHTEGCIDNIGNDEPEGAWLKDDWYWEKEATDWGFYWAAEEDKAGHPPYAPVYRYARDIIGGLNSWLTGWIDWNMVLDFQGGPNHANNWCVAPVLADPETDAVYYTPLYYVMAHFSKFIRPGAHRIDVQSNLDDLMVTACENPDGSIIVEILNQGDQPINFQIQLKNQVYPVTIPDNTLQTLVIQ